MIEKYYQILGVSDKATVNEIKLAYRKKAKELHPDRNKSENAHEQFIFLTEAYEYLTNLKTVKRFKRVVSNEYIRKREQTKASERAKKYAQMQYEDFLKSDYYKTASSIDTIYHHFYFFSSITALVVLPITATIIYGESGFLKSLFIMFVTLPWTVKGLRYSPPLDFRKLLNSFLYIILTKEFLFVSITIINLLLFFIIVFQTLISLYLLFVIFTITVIIIFILTKWLFKINKFKQLFFTFCLTPFIINLFFVINFTFSTNATLETYHFIKEKQRVRVRNGSQESTLIILDNNKYSEYPIIRIFFDYEPMQYKNHITYTFKDGLFGIRIMKDYHFYR